MGYLTIISLTILFSAFFSGLEIAFVSANKLHLELQFKKGVFPYKIVSFLTKHPSRFIATLLVGNNIAIVVYGQMMHQVLVPILDLRISPFVIMLFETFISTVIILFLAEFLPKALFRARAEQALSTFALPGSFFYWLFYPLVSFILGISNFLMRFVFKMEVDQDKPVFSKIDIDHYIDSKVEHNEHNEEEHQIEIFKNALDFSDQKAREYMIPRTEMEAINELESMMVLKERFIETGYSKILVFKENIDNIIGYIHAFELFKKPTTLKSIIRPVAFIPESMRANEVLNLLSKENRSIAVVIDEYGGTAGMLTLEDVVEEIFGEITDEHDSEELLEIEINDEEYRFSARLEIDYLNNKYKLDLPESDNYNTLSGLIFMTTESIPPKGERIEIEDYIFTIAKVSSNRIEEVLLSLPKKQ